MAISDSALTKAFKTPKELERWLRDNHHIANELLIKVYKKGSGIPSVTWNEIVLETLCWGWIDGVKKSLGDEAYVQRISPRKSKSDWSKTNTRHVDRLISEGRMQPSGMTHVEAAKADGRWDNAYAPASEMEIPKDFVQAVKRQPEVHKFYQTLTKSSTYVIAYALETAKKPDTRQRRFDKYMAMLERQEKPDFGFKKKSK